MTVKALIKLLQKEDPNRLVVLSGDSEGNSFSTFSGDVTPYLYSHNEQSVHDPEDADDEAPKDAVKALVLWP